MTRKRYKPERAAAGTDATHRRLSGIRCQLDQLTPFSGLLTLSKSAARASGQPGRTASTGASP
jgi:hypothetical protein